MFQTVIASVTIDGPVTVGGTVDVGNTPGVVPVGNWSQETSGQTAPFVLTDLGLLSSLVVIANWTETPVSALDYGGFTVESFFGGPSGVALDFESFYMPGAHWDETTQGLVGGGTSKTVIPLHGADTAAFSFFDGGPNGGLDNLTLNVYGTNLLLPFSHDVETAVNDSVMLAVINHNLATGASSSVFPIPTSSSPVQVFAHLGAAAAQTSVNMRVIDASDNAQPNIFAIAQGKDVNNGNGEQWLTYANVLRPMLLQFDSTTGVNPITIYVNKRTQLR
jgi:hypothetical protein